MRSARDDIVLARAGPSPPCSRATDSFDARVPRNSTLQPAWCSACASLAAKRHRPRRASAKPQDSQVRPDAESRYALPASVKLTQTQRRPASRPSYQTLIPLRCPRGNLVLGFARMNPAQDHLPPNFGPHNMFTPDRSNPPYIVDRGVHPPDVPLRFDRRHVKRGISSQVECGTTCGGPRICAGVRLIVRIVSGQCSVCMMITAMIAMITGEGVGFSGKLWWVSEVV